MRLKALVHLVFLFSVFLGACSSKERIEIKMKGDDLGAFIFEDFFQRYNLSSSKYEFSYIRGGAQTGLFALADGTVKMVFSLKRLNNEDMIRLKASKIYPHELAMLKVPLLIISSSKIPLEKLDESQLKAIFSGLYKNWWKLTEWKNRESLIPFGAIEVCALDQRNGEYYFFKDKVNIADFALDARFFNHNQALYDYIIQNQSAIGFISLPFYKQNENIQVLFSSPDMEATGYLIMSRELLQDPEIIRFLSNLKVYLAEEERKSFLLQKGIKIIFNDENKEQNHSSSQPNESK